MLTKTEIFDWSGHEWFNPLLRIEYGNHIPLLMGCIDRAGTVGEAGATNGLLTLSVTCPFWTAFTVFTPPNKFVQNPPDPLLSCPVEFKDILELLTFGLYVNSMASLYLGSLSEPVTTSTLTVTGAMISWSQNGGTHSTAAP